MEGLEKKTDKHSRRINVRTLAIRFTVRAFKLEVSLAPPKEGDCGVEPQPTVWDETKGRS